MPQPSLTYGFQRLPVTVLLASSAILFMLVAAGMAVTAPVWLSIATVFLFAGPHNYAEARYFLTRLPARAGRLRSYFVTSITGVTLLSCGYVAVTRRASIPSVSAGDWLFAIGCWNTCLVFWIAALAHIRSLQPPRRKWELAWPAALGLIGLSWTMPLGLPVLMAYAHPLMGLWILDRELSGRRRPWWTMYRRLLWLVPVLIGAIWIVPDWHSEHGLPGAQQLRENTGAFLLPFLPANKLLATHVFLELLHYGVWLIAVPLASGRVWTRRFHEIPLMRAAQSKRLVSGLMLMGAAAVAVLWMCFALDYATTREIYFAVAIIHVLAEIPFLIRLL